MGRSEMPVKSRKKVKLYHFFERKENAWENLWKNLIF